MRDRFFLTLILVLTLAGASGCIVGFASIRGSSDVVTQDENITGFDSVSAGHGCKLTLSQGGNYRVVIRIDDNLRDYLEIERDSSTLRIGLESEHRYRNLHFEVDIQMPDLRHLRLSGGSRGMIDSFSVQDMSIRLSGGSRVEGVVDAEHLRISTSGGPWPNLVDRPPAWTWKVVEAAR